MEAVLGMGCAGTEKRRSRDPVFPIDMICCHAYVEPRLSTSPDPWQSSQAMRVTTRLVT